MSETAISEISCPICFEIYDLPKVLACGHSFCETCILPLIHQDRVECPECRGKVTIPSNGLATNYAMNRLVELMSGVNLVTTVKSEMPVPMESMAKRVVMKAINNDQRSSDVEAAQEIISKFKTKYGGSWQCIVGNSGNFECGIMTEEYICLEVHNKMIYLFKSQQDKPCWKCDGVSCDGTNCTLGQPQLYGHANGTQDDEMIQEAKRVTIQAIKEKTSPEDAAFFIRDHFHQKYGQYWIINISKSLGLAYYFQVGYWIMMKIGTLQVYIFKPIQN